MLLCTFKGLNLRSLCLSPSPCLSLSLSPPFGQAFRMNWGRAHALLLSKESMAMLKNEPVVALIHRMRLVQTHAW